MLVGTGIFLQTSINYFKEKIGMKPYSSQRTNNQTGISFLQSYGSEAFSRALDLSQAPSSCPTMQQSQRPDRVMYQSTFLPATVSNPQWSSEGLGRLAGMGRVIKEEIDTPQKAPTRSSVFSQTTTAPLSFRTDRPERAKMSSSVIFFSNSKEGPHQFSRTSHLPRKPLAGLDSLASKARMVQEQDTQDSSEENGKQYVPSGQNQQSAHNRQLFKSAINLSSGVGNTPFPQLLNFQKQLSSGKKFEFHRQNPKPSPFNSQFQHPEPKKENSFLSKPATLIQPLSSAPPCSTAQQGIMFKKKAAYLSNEKEYTDENLLKALGISLSDESKNRILSPKSFENRETAYPVQSGEHTKPTKALTVTMTHFESGCFQKTQTKQEKIQQGLEPKGQIGFKKTDFAVGKRMGKGQFGEVHLVIHRVTGFLCGMKTMNKKEIKSQKYENQIARELSIQFFLSHRFIAPLYGYFEDEENLYLLVEFCPEGQLLEKLRKQRRMKEHEVSPIIREIAQGMDYIHKEEVIHRDIKPENILFSFGTVKISDFGWAVHAGQGMRRTISGSPLYYSPEIVQQVFYDEKIDIWALGMMTYECLLGKIPFRIYSQLDLDRIVSDEIQFPEYVDVSQQAKSFILGIMKKKPQERMDMRQILRHPFITKYVNNAKVTKQVNQQFRRLLQ